MFRPADQAVLAACVLLGLGGCGRGATAPDLPHAPGSLSPRFYAPRGWTWSTLKLGDGTLLRYGVASPPVVPRGHVLIVPDHDEPGEVWFETANDLMGRGYTVWLLEGASGHGAGALDPAKGALADMAAEVIRPHGQPLVIVAQGLGATIAIRALAEGRAPGVTGAVLASPTLDLAGIDADVAPGQVETAAEWASRARLGWIELPGDGQPRLTHIAPIGLAPRRAGLAAAWRRSDPALRPRRTTFGWVWGYDQAILAARAPEAYSGPIPKTILAATAGDSLSAAACHHLAGCTLWAIPSSAPHLAPDALRREWLERVFTTAATR